MTKTYERADEIKIVDELRALLLYATGAGYREAALPRFWVQAMELVAKYKSWLEGYAAVLSSSGKQGDTQHAQILVKIASKLAIENKSFPVNRSSDYITDCLDSVRDQIEHVHCDFIDFLKSRDTALSQNAEQTPKIDLTERTTVAFERVAVAQERSMRLLERIESYLAHGKYAP